MGWLVFQQVRCLQDFGNVVKVEDLIKECISRTKKILDEKNELTEEEKDDVAKKVGVGALIFSNLSTTLIKDSVFVWDKVLDFTGDTAPYIQYVNVRINSILKNVEEVYNDNITELKENMEENLKNVLKNIDKDIINSDEVYNIFKYIYEYENILKQTAEKYEPSILTSYLLDLAKAFNQYYNKHRISTDDINLRKLGSIICIITSKVLVNGMNILGIEMPDKM